MRILMACDTDTNPYLGQLIAYLSCHPSVSSVQSGTSIFWSGIGTYDVIHFHWPQAIFYWREPSHEQLLQLESRLNYWKNKAVIVATIHDILPHYNHSKKYERLFHLLYSYCDGIIHLGNNSINLFRERFSRYSNRQYSVIPHGDYNYFENEIDQTEARKWFGLPTNASVFLTFGWIRDREELLFLVKGFKRLNLTEKKLIIAGRIQWPRHRIQQLYKKIQRLFNLNIIIYNQYVPEINVQYFLNASDVVIIPRLKILNSGNVPLGFTFGKVVVGPDVGVVGEILRQTGNPVFTPGSPDILTSALYDAQKLVNEGKGNDNKKYAENNWNWKKIAAKHYVFYKSVVDNKL